MQTPGSNTPAAGRTETRAAEVQPGWDWLARRLGIAGCGSGAVGSRAQGGGTRPNEGVEPPEGSGQPRGRGNRPKHVSRGAGGPRLEPPGGRGGAYRGKKGQRRTKRPRTDGRRPRAKR